MVYQLFESLGARTPRLPPQCSPVSLHVVMQKSLCETHVSSGQNIVQIFFGELLELYKYIIILPVVIDSNE